MPLQFGVFDHIEPLPGLPLDRIYGDRLLQIRRLDTAGFAAYHLAEHHTPAIHSLAPSQSALCEHCCISNRARKGRSSYR